MKPLATIYWIRVVFGIVAGGICALYGAAVYNVNYLFRGLTTALLIYIITYYVVKWRFIAKVEKPSKLLTTGIGAYFLAWIVFWTLFTTLPLQTPVAKFD